MVIVMKNPSPSRIDLRYIDSTALQGNPLGDPHRRPLYTYIPAGYDDQPARHYPTAYLLGAIFVSGELLLATRPFGERLVDRLDRLIAEQRIPPMLVVLPDGRSRYGTGQYLDSPAVGRYASFTLEVVAFVDQHYRTIPQRAARAVLGKSSGGFGALHLAMTRPDIFGLVADHSGDKGFDFCYRCQIPEFLARNPDEASVVQGLVNLNATYAASANPMDFFHKVNIAAMAACYSPDPDSSLGFQLPVELHTGRWRPEVWQRWLAYDPINTALQHADALRSLQLLYFDCGNRDEHFLYYGARQLSELLTDAAIAHRYEEFTGGHSDIEHRYDVSFQAIGQAIQCIA